MRVGKVISLRVRRHVDAAATSTSSLLGLGGKRLDGSDSSSSSSRQVNDITCDMDTR